MQYDVDGASPASSSSSSSSKATLPRHMGLPVFSFYVSYVACLGRSRRSLIVVATAAQVGHGTIKRVCNEHEQRREVPFASKSLMPRLESSVYIIHVGVDARGDVPLRYSWAWRKAGRTGGQGQQVAAPPPLANRKLQACTAGQLQLQQLQTQSENPSAPRGCLSCDAIEGNLKGV